MLPGRPRLRPCAESAIDQGRLNLAAGHCGSPGRWGAAGFRAIGMYPRKCPSGTRRDIRPGCSPWPGRPGVRGRAGGCGTGRGGAREASSGIGYAGRHGPDVPTSARRTEVEHDVTQGNGNSAEKRAAEMPALHPACGAQTSWLAGAPLWQDRRQILRHSGFYVFPLAVGDVAS